MTVTESTTADDVAAETDMAGTAQPEAVAPATEQVARLIEALLFVADGPVEESALARVLGLTRRQVEAPLAALGVALRERGLRLQRGPDGAQLVTAPAAAGYIEQFLGLEAARKLSGAALETLAIIAYRQPVTRGTLEAIRGVSCDGPLDTLRARGLIDIAGRADGPGRPTLFATTQKFLEHFGLERAEDLPALPPDVAELAAGLPERAEQLALDVVDALVAADDAGAVAPEQVEDMPPEPQPEHSAPVDADATAARGALAGPRLPGAPSTLPGTTVRLFVPPSTMGAQLPPGVGGLSGLRPSS